jgi:hypothetical protein
METPAQSIESTPEELDHPHRPHVVKILIDDMGYNDIGYGPWPYSF